MFATVAGLSHISVCMAGATTTGAVVVSTVAVRRSSAIPAAIFAIVFAVAGAMMTRSASWPMRTWLTWSTKSKTSVVTGRPESASKVGAPTNSRALGVGTTVTVCPISRRRRMTWAALYAAIPPATPRTTLTGR